MFRPLMMLFITLLVAGCATGAGSQSASGTAQGQSTEEGILINCSGANAGWVFCYRSASTVCGVAGYTVVRRSDQTPPAAAATETRTMLVRCN